MLSFARSKTLGVQPQGDDAWAAHGRLDDGLYTVDLEVRISRPDLVITRAEGKLVRYTTIRCRQGETFAAKAVGDALGPELSRKIKDEVGKKGCRHLANLFADLAQAVARAELAAYYKLALAEAPDASPEATLEKFLEERPGLREYLHRH